MILLFVIEKLSIHPEVLDLMLTLFMT